MGTLLLLGSLAILNLINCAEISYNGKGLNLMYMAPDLLNIIAGCLDNPFSNFGSLNHYFKQIFSTDFSVKRILKDPRYDVPEFLTEDVDENETELELILYFFMKYSNPKLVRQAIKHEFFYGKRFNVLFPHLLNYFQRKNEPLTLIEKLQSCIKRNKFGIFFQNDPPLFNKYAYMLMNTKERIPRLQRYILENPLNMHHIAKYLDSHVEGLGEHEDKTKFAMNWVIAALDSNMPDLFFFGFPKKLLAIIRKPSSIWTRLSVPKDRYPEIFSRINFIIDFLPFTDPMEMEYFKILNTVRFGPVDSNVNADKIKPKQYQAEKLALICHCTSLANKMDLFNQLIRDSMDVLIQQPTRLDQSFSDLRNIPIDLHKFVFDVHEKCDDNGRRFIYVKTQFLKYLSYYYRVVSLEWGKLELKIEFVTTIVTSDSGIPRKLVINRKFGSKQVFYDFIRAIPLNMKFENIATFRGFILRYLGHFRDAECEINGENLKLIAKSEWTRRLIRETQLPMTDDNDPPFVVAIEEAFKVVDEPVPIMADLVSLSVDNRHKIFEFKTSEKLERLYNLTMYPYSRMLRKDWKYFKYRHVYKYIIENGQQLPHDLSDDTRALLQIDFPSIKLN